MSHNIFHSIGETWDEYIGEPVKDWYDYYIYDHDAKEGENPYGSLTQGFFDAPYRRADSDKYWGTFTDLDAQDFINMTDEERLNAARRLTGDSKLTMGDLDKYFPEYDTKEEERLFRDIDQTKRHLQEGRIQGAEDIRDIQLGQRGNLLDMTIKQDSTRARSGFQATGNPMIDRQRDTIYDDISRGIDTSYRKTQQRDKDFLHDIHDKRDDIDIVRSDFHESFGERAITYEDNLEADAAARDAGDDDDCCFIVLEASEGTKLDKYVRQYRDMACTDTNREGYYKLAQVVVPFMRKSKLAKWFFKYSFVAPAKSYAKWYYTGKGIGWIFEPLRKFWLNVFDYLGHKHKLKTDNE